MWKQNIDNGIKALDTNLSVAEQCFEAALEYARDNFEHLDARLPETYAYLGRALLLQKKVMESKPALRQSVHIAKMQKLSSPAIATADYLWAYIDSDRKTDPRPDKQCCSQCAIPDAEQRRESTFNRLKVQLPAGRAEQISKHLAKLFTVKINQALEGSFPKPEVNQELEPEQPEPRPEQKPELKLEPEPEPKLDSKPEVKVEVKPRVTFFKQHLGTPPQLTRNKETKPEEEETPSPERYTSWAKALHDGIERGNNPQLVELISAYVDLHLLMSETVKLYQSPHLAVADHLMALADVANVIGLYDRASELTWLALRNFQTSANANPLKTAYADLALAQILRELDQYTQAQQHFHAALNVIQFQQNLDKEWFEKVVNQFRFTQQKEKVEKQFFEMLDQIQQLVRDEKLAEADRVAREASNLLIQYFPPDHCNFVLLYRRHAAILVADGRSIAADALSHLATYLETKLQDKHQYNEQMDAKFPPFPMDVLQALYNEKIMEDTLEAGQ